MSSNTNDVVYFESGEIEIKVFTNCPQCHLKLKEGKLYLCAQQLKFNGWICPTHGEVLPKHEVE